MSASSDVNHNALKCGTEVSAHSEKEGHGPVARCVATCEAFTNSSNGESFEAKQSYCPFYNGTLGIRTSIDMDCQCGWGKSHCSNAAGVEKECVVYYNGWFCESENGKQRIGYDLYQLGGNAVSSTKYYCDATVLASPIRRDKKTKKTVESAQYRAINRGTDRAMCIQPKEVSTDAVVVQVVGEGFNFYVWVEDPRAILSMNPLGYHNRDEGPNHYGLNYDRIDEADDLIAIGTNGEDMVLAGGLLDRMVCIVPKYNWSGPWKFIVSENTGG